MFSTVLKTSRLMWEVMGIRSTHKDGCTSECEVEDVVLWNYAKHVDDGKSVVERR